MRALYAHGPRDLRLGDAEAAGPGPGEVRVRLARGGICGSDLHYYLHGGFGAVRLRQPMILGHEVAGHVDAVGEGVDLSPGTLVAVSPSRPCGACAECLRGLPNQCLDMRFYGSAMRMPHIHGAFRDVLIADAAQCVPAGDLSPAAAAMAEPLAVALHAVRRAGDMVGARVLVTGCGPIGVLAILAARRAGADEIVATDLSDAMLDHAVAAGADHAVRADAADGLDRWQAGKGTVDVQIEASGAEAACRAGIAALRPRGRLIQLGLSGDMTLPMAAVTAKEIEVRGSFRFHEEFATAVGLMRKGLIDPGPLLTHTFPLDDFQTAFDTATDRSRAMKVQLSFDAA